MKVLGYIVPVIVALLSSCSHFEESGVKAARAVIERSIGPVKGLRMEMIDSPDSCDRFEISASDGKLCIRGSSPTALCYAFNTYLRKACSSMICWSGSNLNLPDEWPDFTLEGRSPYRHRYFLNVCTFGYTTPYWDWNRWSRELDWMALHGVNMPLASVASEAIAKRVWLRLGLEESEIDSFFTGPAHLPWHRMGNLNSYDGPLDEAWMDAQVELQHKILERMRELGMDPVAPAFAGFVPPAYLDKHPELEATLLHWGGFDDEYNACVLAPDSPVFKEIGKLFVEEWEKEFGEADYFLSDSFNEMRLPVEPGDTAGKHRLLSAYGRTIYESIAAGDSDAVWVTQGWTFGYQHDFWDKASLQALLSGVPDDKMIIIDLGNDYPKWVWHTEQSWKVHEGFYGKQWIFSYVPNFGGKVLPTGDLDMYASSSAEALASDFASGLVGFGSAPEGLENNEVVYELLADMGWSTEPCDMDAWLESYCRARYGYCDSRVLDAWKKLHDSVYSSLYSYPRFTWQTVVPDSRRHSRHGINDSFGEAVKELLGCADSCRASVLYRNDVIEFGALWLGELADRHYCRALESDGELRSAELAEALRLLHDADRLLASHPEYSLSRWTGYARAWGRNESEADRYEANAKRLITTWGGFQEDYAARFWSGLIESYYIPRMVKHISGVSREELDAWEEEWIKSPYVSSEKAFGEPLDMLSLILGATEPRSEYSPCEQEEAARALISRVVGAGRASSFDLQIDTAGHKGRDWFRYSRRNGHIFLEGNDGVSIASALKAYLSDCCGWHMSWCGKSDALPENLPLPRNSVSRESPYRYRYNFNYCTFNYSMSWWDWDRWQQEIDFMAMNGINMPLALTGQNSVWQRVYRRLGFTDAQLESFFSGPAYFNWFWMGNLDGWGGPLPQSFMDRHEELQKQILRAERSLGMTPVLPAFTGHVPPEFSRLYPEAKTKTTSWVNFAPVTILEPEEPMFKTIGKMFLEEETALYGTNHFYTADTFNENTPPSSDSLYLSGMSGQVYSAMAEVDPEAVWVMQGWLFHHKKDFWGLPQIRALLDAVPDDNMLILDLWSERYPVWQRCEAYFGKPWLWCMLHNFGQNINLSGNVRSVSNDPASLLSNPEAGRFSGIGLTMEGIGQNPAIYALMLENIWRDSPIDTDEFLRSYLGGRYGPLTPRSRKSFDKALEAWRVIFATAYENEVNNGGQESIITGRPNFALNPGGTTNTRMHYESVDLLRAWDLLMEASEGLDSDGFRYDLVDITRQVLADYASVLQQQCAADYEARSAEELKISSGSFLQLIRDMDVLLGSRKEFLLGCWLEDARRMGDLPYEKDLYELNARNLITTWGNKDCRIRDYACKHWSGLLASFYLPRWERFFDRVQDSLALGVDFDSKAFEEETREWEWNWVLSVGQETYPVVPRGDELELCREIYGKYRGEMDEFYGVTSEGVDREMI